jgi:hypothetical protein
MANEATAALSDAYGHVMHGDDAGSSARVVWVVHPTRVANTDAGGGGDKVDQLALAKVKAVEESESPGRGFGYTQKFGEFCF